MGTTVVSGTHRDAAVRVLGPLLAGAVDATAPLQAARQRSILALLAVATASGRSLAPEELIAGAYDGEDTPRTRRALSTEIWRARQLLGKEAILAGPDGYRLDTAHVAVDAVEFLEQVELGRAALEAGVYDDAEAHIAQALELWRGEPLHDVRDRPQAKALLARLEELRVGAEEDHAEALAGLGRHREAVGILERVVSAHPDREHASALLVSSYFALGDAGRARRTLDAVRRTLADFGMEPGAELAAVRELVVPSQRRASVRATAPDHGLVGREAELAELVRVGSRALRDATTAGVVVSGEAGIGKTTLVQHAASALAAADGARNTVERVVCDRRLTLPYAALSPVLERLRPHADSPAPERVTHAALLEDAADVLERAADALGGLVLVVEDLQWATPEVLEVLLLLLARRSPAPLCVLATVRDPAPMPAGVASAIGELRRRAESVLRLPGLDADALGRLLEVDAAAAAEAHRLTGGNPLYLRHLDGGSRPASLDDALDERLDALAPASRQVLTAAALIGLEFDRRVLTSALAHPPLDAAPSEVDDALRAAVDAGIVVPTEDGFVHGLLRDRLLARVPASERVTLHAVIARALERLAPLTDGVSADVLAHHSLGGWPQCPSAEVVAHLKAAGLAASRQAAYDVAQGYYRQALDLIAMDPAFVDDDEVGALLTAQGQAAVAAADAEGARSAYARLRDHGRRLQRAEFRLRGSLGILETFSMQRVDDRALDDLEAAVRSAVDDGDAPVVPADLMAESLAALHVYRAERARGLAATALERAPGLEPQVLARLWDQEVPEQQVDIAARLGDGDPLTRQVRRHAAGVAAGELSLDEPHLGWSAEQGSDQARWEALLWQVTTAIATGRFGRAERLLEVADQQITRADTDLGVINRRSNVTGLRGWLTVLRLDLDRLVATVSAGQPNWNVQRPITRVLSVYSLGVLGDREEALARCDELVDEFLDGVAPGRHQVGAAVALAAGAINVGHRRGIELAARLLEPHRGRHALHYVTQYWGSVDYHLGRLAAARGDLDTALREYDAALAAHRRSGSRVFEGLALRAAAAARYHRDADGDRVVAVELDRQAAAIGAEIGMPQLTRGAWPPRGPLDLGAPFGPVS